MALSGTLLALVQGMTFGTIPPEVITDCAQLVKANSIQGMWSLSFSIWACRILSITTLAITECGNTLYVGIAWCHPYIP